MLWAVFTVIAALAQTARNTMQRSLTAELGTIGATQVRFLFGFPFGLLLLGLALYVTGEALPALTLPFWLWTALGGAGQIAATALMLKAMTSRSFVVTTAYTKTEPVQVALFGLVFLGDTLSLVLMAGILIATSGVMILGWPKKNDVTNTTMPALLGIAAGGLFALSAVSFRGGIHSLAAASPWLKASTTLACGLGLQTTALLAFMLMRDRATLKAILKAWKPSMLAGFMGAAASQFWFLGFALTSAAKVRTLALVEVLFAYAISGKVLKEQMTARDIAGLVLVVIGVTISLNA